MKISTICTRFVKLCCLALCTAIFTAPASARDIIDVHTLGSSPDVYRVEIRGIEPLQVMQTGDGIEAGELKWIRVALESSGQRHGYKETSRGLINGDDRGNRSYIKVRGANRIRFVEDPDEQNDLWIHVPKSESGRLTSVNFIIYTRELDCTGKIKCKRGSYGTSLLTFDVPVFSSPPPQNCGPQNTYRIRNVNGQMSAEGLNFFSDIGFRDSGGLPIAKGEIGAVILVPMQATICIASTRLP